MKTHLTLKENQEFELDIDLPEVFRITVEGIVQIENDTVTFCTVTETRGYDAVYDNFFDRNWITSAIQSHLPYNELNHLTNNYYELTGKI